ncbi:hypothetical protein AB1Y20_017627 [Prymnesium parvum]|uniref:Uncharacterized protein n=1 Tax=Prymnesium parvum TaxID=97485 RepID=A0AB34JM58_PRYPA
MLLEVAPPEATRFLCETSASCKVDAVLSQVVQLHNLRALLASRSQEKASPVDGEASARRKRTSDEACLATSLLSPESVRQKVVVTHALLLDALHQCGSTDAEPPPSALNEAEAGLFFAGRWLEVDKSLSEYVGRNEKSKVSISLRCTGVPPSARGTSSSAPSHLALIAVAAPASAPLAPEARSGASPQENERSLSDFFRSKSQGNNRRSAAQLAVEEEEEEDDSKLTAAQAEKLCASPQVFAALANQRLQNLVREIDRTSSREMALRRLETALEDREFENFTRIVLEHAGIADPVRT